jgi:hypothetical protein
VLVTANTRSHGPPLQSRSESGGAVPTPLGEHGEDYRNTRNARRSRRAKLGGKIPKPLHWQRRLCGVSVPRGTRRCHYMTVSCKPLLGSSRKALFAARCSLTRGR